MNNPAAIYARVSSDRQKESHTIGSQTSALVELLRLASKTGDRSPKVSSAAFDTQPLNLHSVLWMDRGLAAIGQLARTRPASHPVLVHRLASLLHASFRPQLADGPCASLSLHLHPVVNRTCTSQLSIMLGTPNGKGAES